MSGGNWKTVKRPTIGRIAVALGAVALVIAALSVVGGTRYTTITAYFTETKGIYVGDDVTLLSVPIGTITSIDAQPDRVVVKMKVTSDVALPRDLHAAVVGRSLVSVRAITLGPVFEGGAKFDESEPIPLSRTAVPVEWDQVKTELVRLARAIGPNGANKTGSTSRLVKASARYLDGRGADVNKTIDSMAVALQTIDENRGDLFATVRNLQVFVTALNQSDAQVRDFNERLASVAALLGGDRRDLATALRQMQRAFKEARTFLKENTSLTARTLDSIDETMSVVAEQRTYLADALQDMPTAITNFYNILDPRVSAPTGELAPNNFASMAGVVCGALVALDPEGGDVACRDALQPLLKFIHIDSLPIGLNPLSGDGPATGDGTATPDEANTLP